MDRRQAADGRIRKRKPDNYETNEQLQRVSKRLKRLSLELNGRKIDVPSSPTKASKPHLPTRPVDNESMQLDNTANKVYIYNLDDELSDSDSSSDESKLVFLPDIEKRLRSMRIPPSILANSEGELAGRNVQTDLVLYNVPSSLSVPEDKDSVRKAIIETRARARERQKREQEGERTDHTEVANGSTFPTLSNTVIPTLDIPGLPEELMDDPDAMDID